MKISRFIQMFATLILILSASTVQAAPLSQVDDRLTEARVASYETTTPAWQDDFETLLVRDFWPEGENEKSSRAIEDSAYHITVKSKDTVSWGLAGDLRYGQFLISVQTQAIAGAADNEFGIVFRYLDEANFYVYTVSSDGYISLARLVDDEWETLLDWTESDAIDANEGAWNRLGLLVEEGQIVLLVNGWVVATVEDESTAEGQIGLLAGAHDADGVEIAFDDFAIWDLQNLYVLTDAPTVTPPAIPTVRAERPAIDEDALVRQLTDIRSQAPLLHSDFRRDDGVWTVQSTASAQRFYQRGAYHIQVNEPNIVSWSRPSDELSLTDFYLEAEATQVAGPLNNEFGLPFRLVDNDNYYYYKISSDGYFALERRMNGEWETLLNWRESTLIETGERSQNLMGVLAEGNQITLLVNDSALATLADDTFRAGDIALAVGTFDESGVEVAFDDVGVWSLDEVAEPTATALPTALPTATATPAPPTATPEPEPVNAAAMLAPIRAEATIFSDDFRRPDSGWGTVDNEEMTISAQDRALHFVIKQPQWLGWSFHDQVNKLALTDYLLEVDAQHLAGPSDVGYGLIFGFQDAQNYQRLFVSQNGYYTLQKFVNGAGQDLAPWTQSPAIDSADGAVNRLGLLVQGSAITVLINETVLTQVTDDSAPRGALGLTAVSADVAGLEVAFDNFDLWSLATLSSAPATPIVATATDLAKDLATIRADEPTLRDEFHGDEEKWSYTNSDEVSFAYRRGALQIRVDAPNRYDGALANQELTDFLVEVDLTQIDGPADAESGLLFRFIDNDNFYLAAISGNSQYSLWKKAAGQWQALTPWTDSAAIKAGIGVANRLGVLAQGEQITLLIDGNPLAQVEDGDFSAGALELMVGTFAEGGIEVAFDNLALWNLGMGPISQTEQPITTTTVALPPTSTLQESELLSLPTEAYNGGYFSLTIPQGWAVEPVGHCDSFGVIVWDPVQPLRQLFFFTSIGPFYMNEHAHQADIAYINQGGFAIPWLDSPVVDPLTPANLLAHFAEFAANPTVQQAAPHFPAIALVPGGAMMPQTTLLANVGGETALVRSLFQQAGELGEGLFAATVAPFMPAIDASGPGTAMSYLVSGVAAPQPEFRHLVPLLLQSLQSLSTTNDYIQQCMVSLDQQWNAALEVGKTMRATNEIYLQSWQDRNRVLDVGFEKYSDSIRGVERVYDPETGQVYELTSAEYELYDRNREHYEMSNLELLPDHKYDLWMQPTLNSSEIK